MAVLAFVTVSPDKTIARQMLERLEDWVYNDWPDVEIIGADILEI